MNYRKKAMLMAGALLCLNLSIYSQSISLKMSNVSVKKAMTELQTKSGYSFVYIAGDVDTDRTVSINASQLKDAVAQILKGQNVSYEIQGKNIVIKKGSQQQVTSGKRKKVTGTVKDANGEPIIGATVVEKGTTNGTVTDFDGNFVLEATEGTSLEISYIGYKTQQLTADSGKTLAVILNEDTEVLDEVVVMGYTTQSRNTLTGAAVALKEEKLKDVSTANVSSMLDGKVAGMNVSVSSGKPGGTGRIRIRGKGSLGSSLDPIWVVDGVIYNEDPCLSPNEIDNLSVLKDASSTALYGSRASNGVIVITTKKGSKDRQKFRVNIQQGLSDLSWGNLEMMNAQQLYDYQSVFNSSSWFTPDLLKHDTDWMDLATQTGLYTNASVSYQGGNEKVDSYLLLDYYRETGAVKEMNYNRYTIRNNNDYKIHEKFKAFTKLQGQYVHTKDQTASLYDSYLYLPWDYPYNEDGTVRTGKEQDWYGRDKNNYLERQYKNFSAYENFYVSATAGFVWTLLDGLTFESNNNVNYKIARDESYVDPNTIGGQAKSGTISNTNAITANYFTNQMLRYKTNINGKHDIQALVAYEYSRRFYEVTSATAKGIISGKEVISGTTGMDAMSGTKQAFNIQSVLSNVNYSFDGRYMLQASYRLDGSSKFGKDNQYGSFYTFSGAWNFNREKFMQPLSDILTAGKLRASWGVVGNMPDGYYNHLSLYTASMYNEEPASFPDQLGNKDLSWEKNQTLNVGVDLSFFNRVNLSLDYYNKYTSDLLYYVKFSAITGYGGQWQNIGAVRNKGFELNLDANLLSLKDWQWDFSFNLAHNKNKIEELYGGAPQISGLRRFEEGRDMDDLYMAEWAGVDPETGSPQWYTTDEDGKRVLTNSYSEATGAKTYVGSAAPKVTGGFNTMLTWKDLSFSASFAYSMGAKLYASGRELLDSDGAYDTYNQMVLKDGWVRWEKPGDIATHPKAISGGNANAHKTSSRYLEDADYLTLKNITLAYRLPKNFLSKLGLEDVTLSFSVDNLFTITPYSQVDPATASYEGNGAGSSTVYPTVRKYVFGLSVGF